MSQKRNWLIEIDDNTTSTCSSKASSTEKRLMEVEDEDLEDQSPCKRLRKEKDWDSSLKLSTTRPGNETSFSSTSKSKDQKRKDYFLIRRRKQLLTSSSPSPSSPELSVYSIEKEYGEENESGFCEDTSYNSGSSTCLKEFLDMMPENVGCKDKLIEVTPTSIQKRRSHEPVKVDYFSCFPDEMILRILKLLPQKALGRIGQVSSKFRRLTQDESLWKRMDLKGKFLSVESMSVALSRKPVYLRLAEATVLEQASLNTALTAPQLTFLDLSMSTISGSVLAQLLKMCSSLVKLSLENLPVSNETLLSMNIFAHSIETLNLVMCSMIEADAETLCDYLAKCERLKELNLSCVKQKWTKENFVSVMQSLTRGVVQLNVSGYRALMTDKHVEVLVERCGDLSHLDLSDSPELTVAGVRSIALLLKLEELCLTRCYAIPASAYAYLVSLKSLRKLEVFSLFREPTLKTLGLALPGIIMNSSMFSTIARPTVGLTRSSIWSQRVRN